MTATLQMTLLMLFTERKTNPTAEVLTEAALKIGQALEMKLADIVAAEQATRLDLQHRAAVCEGWKDECEFTYHPVYAEGKKTHTWKFAR